MRSTAPDLQRYDEPVLDGEIVDASAVPTAVVAGIDAAREASASSRLQAKYAAAVRRRQQLVRERRKGATTWRTESKLDADAKAKKKAKTMQTTAADAAAPAAEIL